MDKKKLLLIVSILFLAFNSQAQRRVWDGQYVRLGVQAGVNHFNISTSQLPVQPATSWTAGFTTRASFYNEFQFIYGINFYDLNLKIDGREEIEATTLEPLDFNMIAVQGNFFGSYMLLDHYLSIEAGPVVQVNGKLDARQDIEYYYLGNYDIEAVEYEDVSAFNVNFAVGLSGGFETVKFWVQYQHGLNNIFKRLKDEDLQEIDPDLPALRGNISMISGGVTMFL